MLEDLKCERAKINSIYSQS